VKTRRPSPTWRPVAASDIPLALPWIVPPTCAGQLVERAYAWGESPYLRISDSMTGSLAYFIGRWEDFAEPGDWDPATREPRWLDTAGQI
jgi:hypothetical protein